MEQNITQNQLNTEYQTQQTPIANSNLPITPETNSSQTLKKKVNWLPYTLVGVILIIGIGYVSIAVIKNYAHNKTYQVANNDDSLLTPTTSQNLINEEEKFDLPIIPNTNGNKITIDVNGIPDGTLTIVPGWQVEFTDDSANPIIEDKVFRSITIKNGEYSLGIVSFGTGLGVCGTSNDLKADYISFEDEDGYKYFRQEQIHKSNPNTLALCSNGQTGKSTDEFGDGATVYGMVYYHIPNSPDKILVNQMDNMLASFDSSAKDQLTKNIYNSTK